MRELLVRYIIDLYQDVPTSVYEGLLSIFCLGAVVLIALKGMRKGWRLSAGLLAIEYIVLIYCSTVIFRDYSENVGHDFSLFWSYRAIENGRRNLLAENIMNVVVFVPVGLLMGLVIYNKLKLFKAGLFTVVFGLLISASIEVLQFFLKRGFSELDDVFHNTLGCLIGFVIVATIKGIWLLQKRYLMSWQRKRKLLRVCAVTLI